MDILNRKGVYAELRNLLSTLICASVCGGLCKHLGIPAPYLLGSMFGVWMLSATIAPLRAHMQIPRWFHIIVVLGLGVLIGAMFSPASFAKMQQWLLTLGGMLLATVISTLLGYRYLTGRRNYDRTLALFCAIPGGQAEVMLLSREFVDKDYVVALFHLLRVVIVFCAVPLALAFTEAAGAVEQSNLLLAKLPGVLDLSPAVLAQFVAIALLGFYLARLCRAPLPYLTGPLFLSMSLHLTGIVAIPRIKEFVFLAQLSIGGAVGARLAQVDMKVLQNYLQDALVNVILLLMVFVAAAYLMAILAELEFVDVMLAFVPGGLYEVTLLSLIFGFDVAFIAIHHGTRMLFILFSLPFLLRILRTR